MPPLTSEEKAERKTAIFSTDLANILGVGRGNAVDVWAEKTMDLVEPGDNGKSKPWFATGHRLEPVLLGYAAESLGPLHIGVTARHKTLPLGAHVDGVVKTDGQPVEAKTAGIASLFGDQGEFGEFETDQVPFAVILQCHAHMMCLSADTCYVPTLIGGRGFGMFRVPVDPELCDMIAETVDRWWTDHVVGCQRPDPTTPISLDILKRARREPKTVAQVPEELIETLIAATAVTNAAEEKKKAAKAAILEAMGDAEATQIDPTSGGFTYLSHMRSTIDLTTLRAEHADIAEQCTVTKAVRTLRYKKPPK